MYVVMRVLALVPITLYATTSGEDVATAGVATLVLAAVWVLASGAVLWVGGGVAGRRLAVVVAGDFAAMIAVLITTGGANSGARPMLHTLLLTPALVFAPRVAVGLCLAGAAAFLAVALPDVAEGESHALRDMARTETAILWVTLLAGVLARARASNDGRLDRMIEGRRQLLAAVLDLEARQRREFATDLHEGAMQQLLAARQDLQEAADGPQALARAEAGLDAAVTRLRETIARVHPVALDHGGLGAALRVLADDAGRQGGFVADVRVDERASGVADEVMVDVARMALGHVLAHGEVNRVAVLVGIDDDQVVLTVEDDGPGLTGDDAIDGVGLAMAAERMAALGGELDIAGQPGRRTILTARLPLP